MRSPTPRFLRHLPEAHLPIFSATNTQTLHQISIFGVQSKREVGALKHWNARPEEMC